MHPNWTETLADFLRREPGIEALRLDPAGRRVSVATIGTQVDADALRERLADTLAAIEEQIDGDAVAPPGFTLRQRGGVTEFASETCVTAPGFWKWREFAWPEPEEESSTEDVEWRSLAALAGVCGVAGILGFLSSWQNVGPTWLPTLLYMVALIAGGWDAAEDSWKNLRRFRVDIHFLMLAVAVGAVAIGAWGEAVLLLFLFSASGAMEAFALARTHREVNALLRSAPKTALQVLPDGSEQEVAVETLQVGARVRVLPGGAFPADGTVVKGASASDESTLTGEAMPVEKSTGDSVFSGTINLWGVVEFEVSRLAAESTLQKIIRLIRTAQKLRAPSERFTDKFGGTYTLAVLGGCAAMFLIWWLVLGLPAFANEDGVTSAFYRSMTLLVVTSPCALVLSIPSAILAAIAWGARHGVLFRGGAAIEKLAAVTAIAMDKTGTLTTGELTVIAYESFPAGRETEVMELAYALESNSDHPLARAIVRDGRSRGVRVRAVSDFQSLTGQGVRARMDGGQVIIGRRELLERGPLSGWVRDLPPASSELAEVWIIGAELVGRVLLRDQIRAESAGVLDQLRKAGIRTIMLTGDRRQTAESVAQELGVDDVRSGLSPEDKVAAIQELRQSGHRVAMVGDGVNDAPSLAAADVSVAMGARGSDAALEQAEVILMHDRIENVMSAIQLSRRARTVIRQNLVVSLGVVVVMATFSIIGVVPLAAGVAAHEGSTVVVCLNSLRLLFGRNRTS